MPRTLVSSSLLLLAAACRSSAQEPPPGGPCAATVAGRPAASFDTLERARGAFTRRNGSLTATLHDAAWIRLEGDLPGAERRHRAYFEHGYTTFDVVLQSERFSQPTAETFVLEDSMGARVTGRPLRYEGGMTLQEGRWPTRFELSFPHVLTAETAWIRLSRPSDGSAVVWDLRPSAAPAQPPP